MLGTYKNGLRGTRGCLKAMLASAPRLPERCVEGGFSGTAFGKGEGELALIVGEPRVYVVGRNALRHVGLPCLPYRPLARSAFERLKAIPK